MKRTLVLLLLLLAGGGQTAVAEPYFSFVTGQNRGSIRAPDSPQHPIDSTSTSESDYDIGVTLNVGYLWNAGWYAEGGWTDIGPLYSTSISSGENADFSFQTSATREEDANAIELKIGRLFNVTRAFALYVEAGAHRFSNTVDNRTRSIQTEKATGDSVIDSSNISMTEKSAAVMYGAGFVIGGDQIALKISASRYGDIDRTAVGLGVRMRF